MASGPSADPLVSYEDICAVQSKCLVAREKFDDIQNILANQFAKAVGVSHCTLVLVGPDSSVAPLSQSHLNAVITRNLLNVKPDIAPLLSCATCSLRAAASADGVAVRKTHAICYSTHTRPHPTYRASRDACKLFASSDSNPCDVDVAGTMCSHFGFFASVYILPRVTLCLASKERITDPPQAVLADFASFLRHLVNAFSAIYSQELVSAKQSTMLSLVQEINLDLRRPLIEGVFRIMLRAKQISECDRATVYICDPNSDQLHAFATDVSLEEGEAADSAMSLVLDGGPATPVGAKAAESRDESPHAVRKAVNKFRYQTFSIPYVGSIAGYCARTGEVFCSNDVYTCETFNSELDNVSGYRTKSMLCVPIFAPVKIEGRENHVIGVIQLINKLDEDRMIIPFRPADIDCCQVIAKLVAMPMHNRMTFSEIENSVATVRALLSAATNLGSRSVGKSFLGNSNHMIALSQDVLSCARCSLFLVEESSKTLFTFLTDNMEECDEIETGETHNFRGIRIPLDTKSVAGISAVENRVMNIKNAYACQGFNPTNDLATGFRTQSILVVPFHDMSSPGFNVIGVIQWINKLVPIDSFSPHVATPAQSEKSAIDGSTTTHQVGFFTAEDENVAKSFASLVAVTITNSNMYSKLNQQSKRLLSLFEFATSLPALHTVESVAVALRNACSRHVRSAVTRIFLMKENDPDYMLVLDKPADLAEKAVLRAQRAGTGMAHVCMSTCKVIRGTPTEEYDPDLEGPLDLDDEAISLLFVPISTPSGDVIGCIECINRMQYRQHGYRLRTVTRMDDGDSGDDQIIAFTGTDASVIHALASCVGSYLVQMLTYTNTLSLATVAHAVSVVVDALGGPPLVTGNSFVSANLRNEVFHDGFAIEVEDLELESPRPKPSAAATYATEMKEVLATRTPRLLNDGRVMILPSAALSEEHMPPGICIIEKRSKSLGDGFDENEFSMAAAVFLACTSMILRTPENDDDAPGKSLAPRKGFFSQSEADSRSLSLEEDRAEQVTNWKIGEIIGSGGFGTVSLAHETNTGRIMAVKTIEFNPTDADIHEKVHMLQTEVRVLKALEHPAIVQYYTTERVGASVHILMEFVPGGSIAQTMERFGPISEPVVASYTKQLVSGLMYLHNHDIVHGDIKGANILIDLAGHAKLADFGSASLIQDVANSEDTPLKGTVQWMSPEVATESDVGKYSDIWSLGCLVMEMLTGRVPWAHIVTGEHAVLALLSNSAKELTLPGGISTAAADFISLCTQRDPNLRPTAEQLLGHHFLKSTRPHHDMAKSVRSCLAQLRARSARSARDETSQELRALFQEGIDILDKNQAAASKSY